MGQAGPATRGQVRRKARTRGQIRSDHGQAQVTAQMAAAVVGASGGDASDMIRNNAVAGRTTCTHPEPWIRLPVALPASRRMSLTTANQPKLRIGQLRGRGRFSREHARDQQAQPRTTEPQQTRNRGSEAGSRFNHAGKVRATWTGSRRVVIQAGGRATLNVPSQAGLAELGYALYPVKLVIDIQTDSVEHSCLFAPRQTPSGRHAS